MYIEIFCAEKCIDVGNVIYKKTNSLDIKIFVNAQT